MSKFKITIIDQNIGSVVSEIIESDLFPAISSPQHFMQNGAYGIPVKVELLMEASEINSYDYTDN